MGFGHPPRNKQDLGALLRAADNVVSQQHRGGDEFFDALSPLLEEVATLPDDESPLSLHEENARLRALAVKLSNLVGDLPVREWEDAVVASTPS
jgi:hypothetical protein